MQERQHLQRAISVQQGRTGLVQARSDMGEMQHGYSSYCDHLIFWAISFRLLIKATISYFCISHCLLLWLIYIGGCISCKHYHFIKIFEESFTLRTAVASGTTIQSCGLAWLSYSWELIPCRRVVVCFLQFMSGWNLLDWERSINPYFDQTHVWLEELNELPENAFKQNKHHSLHQTVSDNQ